jgi:phosphoglycolate phosphatase-like HAD superfamily hydrolase
LSSALLLSLVALGCAHAATEPCVPTAAAPETAVATTSPAQSAPKAAPAATPQPVAISLASWRDGAAKQRIQSFIRDVSTAGGPQFLAPEQRIAVFDNDGTLWSEQPLYFQFIFAAERVRGLLDKDPVLAKKPWAEALRKDGLKAHLDQKALIEIVTASEAGISTDEFREVVRRWLSEARHPRFARPYTELTFVPMLELLALLRQNAFKVYIVSGGSVQFMRAFAELVYGVPPEQVIGSAMETKYQFQNGKAELIAQPQLGFYDDGSGKAVAIDRIIGKRPVFIAGNSDGDFEMLEYGSSTNRPSLGLIVHHDDEAREFAYDRQSHIGKLDRALTAAPSKQWLVVSMKTDFAEMYAPKR